MGIMKQVTFNFYCKIVNENSYVRDFYQLPNIVDPDFHARHRFSEWMRLLKLIIKFRILKRKPSAEELNQLEQIRAEIASNIVEIEIDNNLVNDKGGNNFTYQKIKDMVDKTILSIQNADLLRNNDRNNVLVYSQTTMDKSLLNLDATGKFNSNDNQYIYCRQMEDLRIFQKSIQFPIDSVIDVLLTNTRQIDFTQDEKARICRFKQSTEIISIIEEVADVDECAAMFLLEEFLRYMEKAVRYFRPVGVIVGRIDEFEKFIIREFCTLADVMYSEALYEVWSEKI